jgi:uncharacterized Zn finger protein
MKPEKITLKVGSSIVCKDCGFVKGFILMRGGDTVVWRCSECGKVFEITIAGFREDDDVY